MTQNNIQILDELLGPEQSEPETVDFNNLTPLENVDELFLIVDRSGSMNRIKDDAEGGVNAFIDEQQEDGEANITLVEFDHAYDEVYSRIPITNAPSYTLRPRGRTALLDAIGRTLQTYRDVQTTGKMVCVIVTDGHERDSTEWDRAGIKLLIEDLRESGWEFVFLAADEDALEDSTNWGMQLDSSMVFDRAQGGAQNAAYAAIGTYTTSLRSGKSRADSIADMDEMIKGVSSVKKLS